jgi:xanthine/CO dehydrogenase XdhC/CoxF family maturation factor
MKALRQIIERVRENPDEPWAVATLVETQGSTYRKPGARMLIDSHGGTVGVLSGGCLEEEIARRGREIIGGAAAALIEFDTRRLYGCDGHVRILVERVGPARTGENFLVQLGAAMERRQPCRLRTRYEGEALGTTFLLPDELIVEKRGTLVHCVPLPVRLLLFGTGPEIEPVRQLAHALGWVIHHFTHPSELPADLEPDSQTAALVMTHHFGRDLTALDLLLPLQLPYLGLLGPRKRHRQLLEELFSHRALDPAGLAAIHAPAGLDLGSEAPEEIALSIVSEVSAVLAARHGGHLRDRATAIHLAADENAERVA